MSAKPPASFPVELWGNGSPPELSARERQLVGFAVRRFGRPLTRFLLSGLGEKGRPRAWGFAITFRDGRGAVRTRRVRVVPDDRPDLACRVPRRREPLVVLALLRLLIGDRQSFPSRLSYGQEEVLTLLGWEDTRTARRAIDEAVSRYAALYYEWTLSAGEMAEAGLRSFRGESRFVTGYGYQNTREGGRVRRTFSEVSFNPEFVAELTERSLFGVNWNRTLSVTRDAS